MAATRIRQPPQSTYRDAAGVAAAEAARAALPQSKRPGARAGAPRGRRLAIAAGWALLPASLRYWSQLAPYVREQIRHWEQRAEQITEPMLRALALEKLRHERFNAEAAAMIATRAPAAQRRAATRAILALEILYDYLDGLSERALDDPIADGEALYAAFVGAVDPDASGEADQRAQGAEAEAGRAQGGASRPTQGAEGYLRELADAARAAIAELPACAAIAPSARRCAQMGARAQALMHAAPQTGTAELERWAREEAQRSALPWRELLAGSACSVLTLHALIAAAADPATTQAQAQRIEAAYLPSCAMMTLLDGVVDAERDAGGGRLSYAGLYESPQLLGEALARCAREARRACAELPDGAHHAMMLAGAAAYWISTPGARSESAEAVLHGLRDELSGLLTPPLLLMHGWRKVKRIRAGGRSSE